MNYLLDRLDLVEIALGVRVRVPRRQALRPHDRAQKGHIVEDQNAQAGVEDPHGGAAVRCVEDQADDAIGEGELEQREPKVWPHHDPRLILAVVPKGVHFAQPPWSRVLRVSLCTLFNDVWLSRFLVLLI